MPEVNSDGTFKVDAPAEQVVVAPEVASPAAEPVVEAAPVVEVAKEEVVEEEAPAADEQSAPEEPVAEEEQA